MLTATVTASATPACFGISFFAPGEGPCNTGCSLAQRCRSLYLESAQRALAAEPGALCEDERAYLLTQRAESAPATPISENERGHIEDLCARAEAVVSGGFGVASPPAPRKAPERWTDARRRPLSAFKPTSVTARAVEVLRAAAGPLHVCDIAAEVLALATERGIRLGGATPAATVGLALRKVEGVRRVGRGVYIGVIDS
jgi:hypothetical protein